jgi:hypothetical protein
MTLDVVHLVEVDVIGLQPAQAVLAGLANVVGRQAPVVGPGAHRLVDLRREHDPVPAPALRQPGRGHGLTITLIDSRSFIAR